MENSPVNPYPSQVNVQNLSWSISDLNLKLNGYSHDFPDNAAVLLVGPKGQKALLMSDVGGGDVANAIADVNLTLDDEAAASLPDSMPHAEGMTSGTYKPTQGTITTQFEDCAAPANFPSPAPVGPYAKNLSVFDNTDPNGTWSSDRATLDPTNSLKAGATYKAVVTTGAKDLAGNGLDQSSTLSGLQQKAWTFKVRN